VRLWRLVEAKWADDPLDGRGASEEGGRWNPVGVPVVYASTSLALAAMEQADVGRRRLFPKGLRAVEIEVPDSLRCRTVAKGRLPRGWRRDPPPASLAAIGERWCVRGDVPLLRVPSAVLAEEWNVLVNPSHREARRVRVRSVAPFSWDPRYVRG
jgi:RES domain-containing protein